MRRALYWVAVVMAVTALAGGAAFAYVGYRATSGPDGAVKGYFAALARGDAPAALAFGDVPAGPHELLTSPVLAEQQRIAPLHDLQILDVTRSGDRATVRYSYQLRFARGNHEYSGRVAVVRRDGGWRLAATAVATSVRITGASDRIAFGGAGVPDGPTLLFPGALPLRVDTPNIQVDPATSAVQLGGGSVTQVRLEPSAAARAALLGALRAKLTACVAHGALDADCPLPSSRIVPGSLRGRLTTDLDRAITIKVGAAAAGTITLAGTAGFHGTYRRLDFTNVPHTRSGTLRLAIDAEAPAVGRLALHLDGS